MEYCIGCNTYSELIYKNVFCSDCNLDRLINESSIFGIPIYVLVIDSEIKVIIDDPGDLLGRVKPKIVKKIINQYSR